MATSAYKTGLRQLLSGAVPFGSARIGVMLLDPDYTFNANSEFVSNVSDNEVVNLNGTGYFRKILEGRSVEVSGSNIVFKADDPRWSLIEVNSNVGSAVLFAQSINDNTSSLLLHYELPETETVGADLVVEFENGEALKSNIP